MTAVRADRDYDRAVVGFTRLLRAAGLPAPVDRTVLAAAALDRLGWSDPGAVYWGLHATLCGRPEDRPIFEACFRAWFGGGGPAAAPTAGPPVEVTLVLDAPDGEARDDDVDNGGDERPVLTVRYSPAEARRELDFARYDADDHAAARVALGRLALAGPTRRSARRRAAPGPRGPIDLRRTVRAALRTDGEPIRRLTRDRSRPPRRIVVLCDVSGSMEPYARVLLRFLHAAVSGRRAVEAFAFGTRLTRLTRELSLRDPDAAIAAAVGRVTDWSGGTRLGEALTEFNDGWGVRGVARGAVVVVVSDGWDRGDPTVVAEQMARLARVAHRIAWVNPLKASPGYEPLAGGMAAALPYVDEFLEGHSLASLESLTQVIEDLG